MSTEPTPALTPSQTIGPFLHIQLPWPDGPDVVTEGTPGLVTIHGRLTDGNGAAVPDALVETWQADPSGGFGPDFRGFGRCPTDPAGEFFVRTVKPGTLPAPGGGTEAPHIDVSVFARGLLDRVVTRIYFPDEEAANAADPVLSTVEEKRRPTLIATAEEGGYRFDIRLRGDEETVFFDV
jgi:protocatechuate 3,4-dioxygenase alpha subunit